MQAGCDVLPVCASARRAGARPWRALVRALEAEEISWTSMDDAVRARPRAEGALPPAVRAIPTRAPAAPRRRAARSAWRSPAAIADARRLPRVKRVSWIRPQALRPGDRSGVCAPAGRRGPGPAGARRRGAARRSASRCASATRCAARRRFTAGTHRRAAAPTCTRCARTTRWPAIVCARGGAGAGWLAAAPRPRPPARRTRRLRRLQRPHARSTSCSNRAGLVSVPRARWSRCELARRRATTAASFAAALAGRGRAATRASPTTWSPLRDGRRRRAPARRLPLDPGRGRGHAAGRCAPDARTRSCSWRTWTSRPTASTACCCSSAQSGALRRRARRSCSATCRAARRRSTADYALEDVILEALAGLDVPIALGLSSGHTQQPVRDACRSACGRASPARRTTRASRSWRPRSREGPPLGDLRAPPWPRWPACCASAATTVTGSDQDVYPPMSTQLEALGIAVRSPYARGQRARGRRPGGDRQRALARQPRGGGRARPQAAHDQHARAPGRGVPARPHLARGGGHPRQDHDHEPARLPARPRGPRPVVPDRRRARGLRAQLPAGRGRRTSWSRATSTTAPSSTSGRSSSTTCPTSRSSATSSTTTPTSTPTWPRCRRAFVRLLQRRPAPRPAGGGRREPGAARAPAARARRRWRPSASAEGADWRAVDVRPAAGRLDASGCSVRGARPGRVHAAARRASTTCATRWPRWPRPAAVGRGARRPRARRSPPSAA